MRYKSWHSHLTLFTPQRIRESSRRSVERQGIEISQKFIPWSQLTSHVARNRPLKRLLKNVKSTFLPALNCRNDMHANKHRDCQNKLWLSWGFPISGNCRATCTWAFYVFRGHPPNTPVTRLINKIHFVRRTKPCFTAFYVLYSGHVILCNEIIFALPVSSNRS